MMKIDIEKILENTKKYLAIPSPTGFTQRAVEEFEKEAKSMGFKTFKTNKGALMVEVEGKNNSKSKVITAHIDTLGAMVKCIEPDGKIRYNRVGGGCFGQVEGENATIISRKNGEFRGSIMPDVASTHIYGQPGANVERNQDNMYFRLDEKISKRSDVQNLGIGVGDYIYMDTRFEVTDTGFVKSRYLDNKLAVAMVLELLKMIERQDINLEYKTYFYISNYEEAGHGISYLPEDSFEMIAIDIGIVGDRQNSDEYSVSIAAKDKKTPYNYEFRNKLVDLCEEKGIGFKVDLYNFYSTDSTQAMHQGKDINFSSIGPGVNSTHHYERTHIESIDNTMKLLIAYIEAK